MSPASFKIMLDAPEAPPPPPSRPVNPAALTREERHNNNWHVRFIAWVLGLPSILSIVFVGLVGLYYAFVTTGDAKTWLALSAGIMIVTLFTAGLPIGAALNRETEPGIAKAAFGFWAACIALLFAIMAHFAWHQPQASPVSQSAPIVYDVESRELIENLERAFHGMSPSDYRYYWLRDRIASAKREAARVAAIQNPGEPAQISPEPDMAHPDRGAGLDLAAVALLTLIGAALGLLISASSLAAILTEKAATVRVETEAAPVSQPAPAPIAYPGENADGFEAWALQCVSKLPGGKVRTAEAHANYLQFAARNDYVQPLGNQEFGRRLRGWLADNYGVDGRHSNGTVFDGVTLALLGNVIAAPAINGVAA